MRKIWYSFTTICHLLILSVELDVRRYVTALLAALHLAKVTSEQQAEQEVTTNKTVPISDQVQTTHDQTEITSEKSQSPCEQFAITSEQAMVIADQFKVKDAQEKKLDIPKNPNPKKGKTQ
ncbi:hypothetical protein ACJJTC_012579 [Scirpophaga incertulas]